MLKPIAFELHWQLWIFAVVLVLHVLEPLAFELHRWLWLVAVVLVLHVLEQLAFEFHRWLWLDPVCWVSRSDDVAEHVALMSWVSLQVASVS